MKKNPPSIIQEVGFDFSWDEQKVWMLDILVEEIDISELIWHFAIPFWSKPDGFYDLKAQEVIDHPELHAEEYERTMKADTSHPIDIMFHNGRWVILDGLHRLVKQSLEGKRTVRVRKVPRSAVPLIEK